MTKKYKVLSLFSGCGGLDLGFIGGFNFMGNNFSKNNFEIVWSNEIDKNACQTYTKNFKHEIVCGDIRDILENGVTDMFSQPMPKNVDVVLGGFPCQDFSVAGKRRGLNSHRGNLYKSMIEVIKRTSPQVFLAENVKGILSIDDGNAITKIKKDFGALGYNVTYKLFHVANFGVAQNRERVIIIGTKYDSFDFPETILDEQEWIDCSQVLKDLSELPEGAVSNHFWSKAKKNKGQGNSVINKDGIAPTMRAEHHGNIEFHYNGERRLSAREAARIQSFPDDFIFYPSTSAAYRQIGNAVPPIFGWHIAKSIEKHLDSNYHTKNEAKSDRHNVRRKPQTSAASAKKITQTLSISGN